MTIIRQADDLFHLFREEHLFERFGLQKVGVFGSLARGERFNDIDILIEDEVDYKNLVELKKVLEEETGYKVDIMQRKYAEPVILFRALKEIRYAAAS
jgi:uncharacterized protein